MEGQPLRMDMLLPSGVMPEDFYTMLAAFVAFVVVFFVGSSFIERDRFAPRIKSIQERRSQLKGEYLSPTRRRKMNDKTTVSFMRAVVGKLKLLQDMQVEKLQKSLINAGWRSKDALIILAFLQFVLPFAFLLFSLALLDIDYAHPLQSGWKLLIPFAAGWVGLKIPSILLLNQRNKRHHAIQMALSDTLDLMLICAEAGLSLAASLDRVSRELGRVYPEMAEELSLTSVELGFLPERRKALENLAYRVDIQEIRGITSVLIQTEKYGTPIAQALRTLASEFRTQRMLRAEQKAARLPAIMTVPMIMFILPTLFIIVVSPAVIKLMGQL